MKHTTLTSTDSNSMVTIPQYRGVEDQTYSGTLNEAKLAAAIKQRKETEGLRKQITLSKSVLEDSRQEKDTLENESNQEDEDAMRRN